MTYNEARELLKNRPSKKYANNTYLEPREAGAIALKLHATDVVTFLPDGSYRLNSGGWRTVTTKDRINQVIGNKVYQKNSIWLIDSLGGTQVFQDGMTVDSFGNLSGGLPLSADKEAQRKKRVIKRYVDNFMKALLAGKVAAPSGGDCWFCALVDTNTKSPWGESMPDKEDHLNQHFKESYFVASLLTRACEVFGVSVVAKDWLASCWIVQNEKHPQVEQAREYLKGNWAQSVAVPQIKKALTRYLYRQFNFAA